VPVLNENNLETSDSYRSIATRRMTLRLVRLLLNALSIGAATTMLLSIGVLWLEKRSGIALDQEQYRGLLLIIFLVFTLSAYVILEFFQHQDDIKDARVAKKKKARMRSVAEPEPFAPIFSETQTATPEQAAPETPPPTVEHTATPSGALPVFGTSAEAAATAMHIQTSAENDASASLFTQSVNAAVAGFEEEPSIFMQFGLHLYIMGGCGEIVQRSAVPQAVGKALLVRMLKDLGLSQRSAAAFAANANTYAQAPNFRGPIDAGYRAMAHLYDSGFVNLADLTEMLEQWRVQDGICKAPEPATFMATSMGSPPPGADPEDQQRVMRAHSRALAAVTARFHGREIHNLGNGAIVAFTDAAQCVRAAEGCQEYLDRFALENPKLHVAPRIGIDTEMAASVNGAYVSIAITQAVTIAARTPPHHIYCSETTCEDSPEVIAFEPVPDAENLDGMPRLFVAIWSRMPARSGPAVEYRQIGTMVDINPALSAS
jgi:hypothetical protein